jgi:hypothetical protein
MNLFRTHDSLYLPTFGEANYAELLQNVEIPNRLGGPIGISRRNRKAEYFGHGYVPRDYVKQPEGSIECCAPLPTDLLIPRSEWPRLIKLQDENQSSPYHLRQRAKIRTKSQASTPFCWAFGSVACLQVAIVASGLDHVELSPTMVACLATGYKLRGGNTFDAIPIMHETGVCSTKLWPLNQVNRRYDTPEMRADAAGRRLAEWFELKPNRFDYAASALLLGFPVILGLAWWGHMIAGLKLVQTKRGGFGILIENSHGESYGDLGLAVLEESRATAFDQAAVRCNFATAA